MRLSNWLLTGTSITLLALAPLSAARAQDASNPALVEAYKAFAADKSDANKQKLDEACKAAGFASLEDCLKALSAPAPAPSSAPPPPAPSSEAAPPAPSSEAPPPPPPSSKEEPKPEPSKEKPKAEPSKEAPPPASSSEEQAVPAASSEEAAPPTSSSSEEPKPKPKTKPKKVPSSSEEQAPDVTSVASPAAASSSEPGPAPSSEVAPPAPSKEVAPPAPPASSKEAPPPAPSSSAEPAPAPSSAQPLSPSSEQPKNNGVARLKRAVDEYNQGVTDLSAGDKAGQAKIDDAKKKIDQLCNAAGIPDVTACLAQFGLVLNPLPPQPGEPSSSTPVAAPSSTPEVTAPTSSQPPPAPSVPPVSELPKASEAVTPSAVEVLPSNVQPSEAAPLLDSQKDQTKASSSSQEQSSSQQPPPPATPPAPPPKSDQQAQQDIKAPPPDQQSLLTDKGKKIDVQQIQVAPPTDAQQPIKVIQLPGPKGPNGGPNGGPNNGGPNGKPPQNGNGNPPQQPAQSNGVIFQIGINIVINNPEQERDRFYDPRQDQIYYEDLGRGRTRETIQRPDGSKIVTVRDRTGDILQRSKVLPNGREIILATYDPRDKDIDTWRDPGDDLPPLQLNIPADQYIMDADTSDDQQVYNFLSQPPVEQVRRIYTIDEVKRSARLRDSVRRLEVGNLTFDSGKATISRNQVGALQDVADAMNRLLQRNPGEVFLIEGHTDAVGSDVSNLVLSDERASTVARILTDFYGIPPENLVTQGYGERYLKVQTDGPEPLNRRVTIKRITPLITYASNQ